MLKKYNKKLDLMVNDIEAYNKHFCNHVGQHTEEYIRRGAIILQVVLIMAVIFFI